MMINVPIRDIFVSVMRYHMKNLTIKIPKELNINIAFSGGVDSLSLAILYKRFGYNVTLLHFHHGCEWSDGIMHGCKDLAKKLSLPIIVGYNDSLPKKGQSIEDAWRRSRYRFLYNHTDEDAVLLTGHHLDDGVESWLFSSMHGEGKIIDYDTTVTYNGKSIRVLRPLLLNTKDNIVSYVAKSGYEPVPDECNKDNGLMRNYIRNVMMPHVLVVNPGIRKVIKKKYLKLLGRL